MVLETSTSITLNTVDLDIHSTEIWAEGLVITTSPDLSYTEDTQMLKISFDKPLHAGTIGRLRQTFTGHISNSMAGISVSKYKDAGGKSRHILSTVLSPIDARRAFPCFDEPALKASFTVTAVAEKHLTCLGNMEVASEKSVLSGINGVKKKAVTFHPTPHMSTYLLCLVIGEFGMIQSNDFRVPIRIFTTPDNKIEHCKFALDLAVRTMKLYEATFDILYPLRKLDMVTIPEQLGATESWGLIQYAARDIIYDEKNSNLTAKQHVADTVQHELAHQWFGNLVTSEYWDDIWLNEGFATWMAWYSSNIFFPQWKTWQNHVLTVLQDALSVDSLRSSHPIEVPITGTSDVGQVFDDITYLKGSSLLRMISMRIGESTFLRGVQTYLKRHAYGNARTSDLWAALSEASGEDIGEVMSIWSQNTGYPVIVVSEDQSSMQIRIQQNRFLKTGDVKKEEDKTLFPIFLRARTEEGAIEDLTVIYREQTFSTKGLKWLKLNADQLGFYRTSYSPARLEKLTEAANSGSLSIEDRIGIIMDAGALATAGYQRTSEVLSLINKLSLESNYFIWTTVLTQIEAVRKALIFEDPKVSCILFILPITPPHPPSSPKPVYSDLIRGVNL
jgi:aminopeptidase 2